MRILISHARVSNFRSLKYIDVNLKMNSIIIGQNNCGKSNFLRAIDIALNGIKNVSEEDIFIKEGETLTKDKKAIIDLKIVPVNDKHEIQEDFDDFWVGVFTDKWITTDETNGNYVGIRTTVEFDIKRNAYHVTRRPIVEWNQNIEESKAGKKQFFGMDMMDYVNSYYMDAQRDVTNDIKDKKSYFGRATSQLDLDPDKIDEIEGLLNNINNELINNIPAFKDTTNKISEIGKTLGKSQSSIQIEPVTRKITDLHKGMDITYKENNTAGFSISQHGMGTRSWISFLTLGAYVDWYSKQAIADDVEADDYALLMMEEPEAHLHPQAQRQLYAQLCDFIGQKIISTHSSNVLAQVELKDIIHFYKKDGITSANRFNEDTYSEEEINRIQREVIRTRGELLFSTAIILCEGITEEQALPIYFKEYFGTDPVYMGINIICVDGQNYKTFLNLIKDFNIGWFIFSDGESAAIDGVQNAISVITDKEIDELDNIFILENGYDFEKYLIKSGYTEEIINAVNDSNGNSGYFKNYAKNLKNGSKKPRRKTGKDPCVLCGQDIYEYYEEPPIVGLTEEENNIYKCITAKKAKARYAIPIAEKIIASENIERRIPAKIKALFDSIANEYNIKR